MNNNIIWKNYNKALIIDAPPHVIVREKLSFNEIRKTYENHNGKKARAIFSLYCQRFDCPFETDYWYIIKDTPLDISLLASKERYEIRKGINRILVNRINPISYSEEIFRICEVAFATYDAGYKPEFSKEKNTRQLQNYVDDGVITYGAFLKSGVDKNLDETLCGFLHIKHENNVVTLVQQKAIPAYEKHGLNAAMIYFLLEENKEALEKHSLYILDGGRAIRHKTGFQDYLVKYFGFRKAYGILKFSAPWYINFGSV